MIKETKDPARKPPGQVVVGEAGVGKTHLIADLRRRTWESGGWFVMLDVLGITDFWRSAALSFITSLLQTMPDGRQQYEAVLAGVARRFKVEEQVQKAFLMPEIEPRKVVDLLVKGLMKTDMHNAMKHQDVFRALALLKSHDLGTVGIAHSWLQGYDADETARRELGFVAPPPSPVELVRGMSWVMSLAGPTMVGVDQIDGIVTASAINSTLGDDLNTTASFDEILAAGLLELYDVIRRGQIVISCLSDSWQRIKSRSLEAAHHRFHQQPIILLGISAKDSVRALIESRLAPAYAAAQFKPDDPAWPYSEAALDSISNAGMTPRIILMRCDAYRRKCIAEDHIEICHSLNEQTARMHLTKRPNFDDALELARRINPAKILNTEDDSEFGRFLREIFELYATEIDPDETIDIICKGDPAQNTPPLHGRLTFTYHAESDRERHFCFRALSHTNANAFQSRLKAALTASGIANKIADRHLLLIRRDPVPGGAKTKQLTDGFLEAGGLVIYPCEVDLRTFTALLTVKKTATAGNDILGFENWLRQKKPLCGTAFFKDAGLFPPPVPHPRGIIETSGEVQTKPALTPEPLRTTRVAVSSIHVGHRVSAEAEPVELPLNVLPRHTAIIAGAGSGKTVLLRRIVEEAALAGLPAIVIDPNNDLSQLGDRWPEQPAAFTQEDAAKAADYMRNVEVVIWTPGIHVGNPLFLSVLPDFAALGDDRDEREQAVAMAAETLGPLAGAKTELPKGVLADTLRYFAGKGGGSLKDITNLLSDLPEGICDITKAEQIAAKMADGLKAAVATNPLLRAEGRVLDPQILFKSENSAKTRISVINLSGLASDAAKEDFVNRLQMTLFGWIKKHPSPKGMLYVIDEAQIFIPASRHALSKTSGVQLVAQARKYGLGMIVATQAPKGIDNKVVSNCTTQFLGKQNAAVTQQAAKEMIAASGGKADDIGKLRTGEFYFKTEASGKPVKIATPICLTYHPANPPTPDEIVQKAKRKPQDGDL